MGLFTAAGFDLYSSDPNYTPPEMSASRPRDRSSIHDFRPALSTPTQGTILTRSRSVTDPCPSPKPATQKLAFIKDRGLRELTELKQHASRDAPPASSGDVQLLPSELACVGLSDELGVDHWGLKIVKLVAFPDLISVAKPMASLVPSVPSPTTPSLYSSDNVSSPLFELSPPIVRGISSSSSSSSSSSEDDGYFSHSPPPKSFTPFAKSGSRSYSELKEQTLLSPYKSPSKHLVSPLSSLSPVKPKFTIFNDSPTRTEQNTGSRVPFFSYTKTPEGCSLTADVYILATLFPPHERHMVICSGELDAADERLANGMESSDDEDDADDDPSYSLGSALQCLQIDLQRFGLGMSTDPTRSHSLSDGLIKINTVS
jgi:hypothetical protein